MHSGRDDVRGTLAAQLDDVFAEVGLDDAVAGGFEIVVETDLLGDHGFGFGNQKPIRRLCRGMQIFFFLYDVENDAVGFCRIFGAMDSHPVFGESAR